MRYKIYVSKELITRWFKNGRYDYTITEGLPPDMRLLSITMGEDYYDNVLFEFGDREEARRVETLNPQITDRDVWSNWMALREGGRMNGRDFISVQAGRVGGKNAAMLELFIQYVLEHTGWSLDEIALYQKVDHAKGETISWIEKKPQVEYPRMMSREEYQRMVLGTWDGEDE